MQLIIPRISNPKEFVEVIHTDLGDVDKRGVYISTFEIEGIAHEHIFYTKENSDQVATNRFESAIKFLRSLDLDLEKYKEVDVCLA